MPTSQSGAPLGAVTLQDPRWIEWNQSTWGVDARPFEFRGTHGSQAVLKGYWYLRNKHLVMPPLNAYLPLVFQHSLTTRPDKITRQWHDSVNALLGELRRARMGTALSLPPELSDSRPLDWGGNPTIRAYTYVIEFPFSVGNASSAIRNKVRKAQSRGYRVERSEDWWSIARCLECTAKRQGFQSPVSASQLARGQQMMGDDFFRGYLVLDSRGKPASGGVRLHKPGGIAVDLLQGADQAAQANGVNQLMYSFVLSELQSAGAMAFDFCGANIPSVAQAKSEWGAALRGYIRIPTPLDLAQMAVQHSAPLSWAVAKAQGVKRRIVMHGG